MQIDISNKILLGENLNSLNDVSGVSATDNSSNLKDVFGKVDKLGNLRDKGEADASLIRYIPSLSDVSRQGQIYNVIPKKAYALNTYVDKKKLLKFSVILAGNTYPNYSSMCIVLPVQFAKKDDSALDAAMVTVNNFFAHWLKEIDVRRCPDDVRILPINNTVDIYRYSAQMLKHLPKKSLDTIKETLLYSTTKVVLAGNRDRRLNNTPTAADRTDASLTSRIIKFHDLLGKKIYYRIPLKFFTDLGLVNFSRRTETKFLFTLESNFNKPFEINKQINPIPANPDAKIILHDHLYILYQKNRLDDNYLAYQNAILQARTALQMGVLSFPYQQSFELTQAHSPIKINFQGANRQFDWLEILLVYDKSNHYQTVYDGYNLELASKFVQILTIENASSTCSTTGQSEFNVGNEDDKHWLYQMFVAYDCDGYSTAPLTQYRNNEI